jgi:hypothetical protein
MSKFTAPDSAHWKTFRIADINETHIRRREKALIDRRGVLAAAGLAWLGPAGAFASAGAPSPAGGAAGRIELVYLWRAGCAWCAHFDRKVAPVYPRTAEGERAPLRRLDIGGDWPADLPRIERIRYTPTFVMMASGREVGRIEGYPGDEFFFAMVQNLLEKAAAGTDRPAVL